MAIKLKSGREILFHGDSVGRCDIESLDSSLLDTSSLTPPPEPRVEAMTCNVESPERGMLDAFPYEGPPPAYDMMMENPFRYIPFYRSRIG